MGIKTKKFSQLSATSDGKLILANDNKLYQSTSSLSELIPNVDNLASKELVQETSATITGMIPSTAGLATETDLQTVSGALSNYEQKITYGYDENEAITAINNSAIGGTGGGASYIAGQGIKIENDTISISSDGCSVTGAYAFAEGQNNSAHGNYSHAEGSKTIASESDSHAEGSRTSAVGFDTHTEGAYTYAIGSQSHAEGNQTSALGLASHAEGQETRAIGAHSHAEGYATRTSGEKSHAEGLFTTAFGKCSHAEGENTKASGYASHAEGYQTSAIGQYSHTEGYYTIADYSAMHVGGALNKTSSDALFVLGNGNVTIQGGQYVWNRSDAFIIYPDGRVSAAGKISANGVELGAGGNEGDELINKTCTIEGTTATVTLDNNNYNIIDTINATVTDLNINIQTSTPKYQKCWFEYDVAKNSVLTGVKSYVNNSEVPISCPSSYDSDKIYQGYSINYLTTINSIDKISPFGTVEVGGRSYKTVKMGNREWMAENLDYPYSEITIGSTSSPTEPRANYYNNDSATYNYEGNKYGLLYNMPALLKMSNDGQFPTGWRLPTTADFQDLFTYIGSSSWATKLCSTAWNNGTDDYGFNMLPAGYRHDSTFSSVNTRTRYWTITVGRNSYIYYMIGTDNSIGSASDVTALNKNQYPVRLVKTI